MGFECFSRFIIGREKPGEQSEVAQLIQQTLEQERWQREMMEQRYKQYMDDDEEVYTCKMHCSNFVLWKMLKFFFNNLSQKKKNSNQIT